ncbi:MAG: amino acid ABC transporter permease, partial [Candidatus Acidiferrales bacterium]
MSGAANYTTARVGSAFEWLRAGLFSSWPSSIATLAILYFAWKITPPLLDWALIQAVWSPENPGLCRELTGQGACWAFVAD